jgi:flagellar biogenesis protein FliO
VGLKLEGAPSTGRRPTMLWTILIILLIIAVALWIFSRLRGGRGV